MLIENRCGENKLDHSMLNNFLLYVGDTFTEGCYVITQSNCMQSISASSYYFLSSTHCSLLNVRLFFTKCEIVLFMCAYPFIVLNDVHLVLLFF